MPSSKLMTNPSPLAPRVIDGFFELESQNMTVGCILVHPERAKNLGVAFDASGDLEKGVLGRLWGAAVVSWDNPTRIVLMGMPGTFPGIVQLRLGPPPDPNLKYAPK
jgi:hypothetical protein